METVRFALNRSMSPMMIMQYKEQLKVRWSYPTQYRRILQIYHIYMIDTVGRGIKKIYTKQRNRFFTMPDQDIDNEHRTLGVTIYGKKQVEHFLTPDFSQRISAALGIFQASLNYSRLHEICKSVGTPNGVHVISIHKKH